MEVRLRREGISCRIDLLSDVPVEIKTGAGPLPVDLKADRPEHVEQLAMYCALTGRPTGRLVHILLAEGQATAVRATDVTFGDLDRVASELRAREAALRSALEAGDGAGLPRCRWFGRGCEFQASGVCGCDGGEPGGSDLLLDEARSLVERPELSDRWQRLLRVAGSAGTPPAAARFRDLVYPRRAFFERTRGRVPDTETPPAVSPSRDLYDRLAEAVESGPVGDVRQLPSDPDGPEEEVVGLRGVPFLLRTSRAGARIRSAEAVARFPQYALELGLRCAATGTSEGHVILGYERAEDDRDRVHVLDYRFRPTATFSILAKERSRALADAIARGSPRELAACAGWMVSDCPYRTECGCDGDGGRSQR